VALRAFSYVLPLRMTDGGTREALTQYLWTLAQWCDDELFTPSRQRAEDLGARTITGGDVGGR
jgi:hypothetical protein